MDNLSYGADPKRIVIVGAGHGGCSTASLLRQFGYDGEIVLVGNETHLPYHRPPLSKKLLSLDMEQLLHEADFYTQQNIDLRLGKAVLAINPELQTISLSDDDSIRYDDLVLATGVCARMLPPELASARGNVHEIRTLGQARELASQLRQGQRIVVVGGGWIGLEMAASAREAGLDVTVVVRGSALLSRVASVELSEFVLARHRANGVDVLFEEEVARLESVGGIVHSVILSSGRELDCDHVVIGIGSDTDLSLARAAGLEVNDGIIVDNAARTSVDHIYAVGDVTSRPVVGHGELLRVESLPSTVEQSRQAVSNILGLAAPHVEAPWFWSDQFDMKLQIVGLRSEADCVTVREYPEDTSRFAVFHTRGDVLLCVEAVNSPGDFMVGKQFIRDERRLDLVKLSNMEIDLAAVAETTQDEGRPVAGQSELSGELSPALIDLPGPGGIDGIARVTFVKRDGDATTIDIEDGLTLMQGAVRNNVPGIVAECGGMATCGTCHIYVDDPWADQLPEPEYEEEVLIEFIEHQRPSSRLGCQILASSEVDGMVVRVAEEA